LLSKGWTFKKIDIRATKQSVNHLSKASSCLQYNQIFKELVFGKKAEKLGKWIIEAQALEIDDINSFITEISRDIEAVKNAITYEYNKILAEGSVNKLK